MKLDLSELKDIHIPIKPDILPLSWGWWLLIWIGFIFILFSIYLIYKYLTHPKIYALKELKRIEKLENRYFLKEINSLLRRIAIYKYGAKNAASLYGEEWLSFLNQTQKASFSKRFLELLEKNMYASKSDLSNQDKKEILDIARKWIRNNL